ncbi:tyrosine-type recombinase/integrase [Sulfurimonas sp.]|nr:tyrosine-type recombinase/integrase [Sulfurimonas sp.]
MALTAKDWKRTKFQSIKQHKKDKELYLFDTRLDGKRYRKQHKYDGTDIYLAFIDWSKKLGLPKIDCTATVEEYFIKSQLVSERNDTTKLAYTRYFNNYISPIKHMKLVDVRSSHITQLSLTTKHLSRSYRKKLFEILIPLFNLAIDDEVIAKSPIKQRQVVVRKAHEEMKVVTDAVSKYKLVHKTIHEVFKDNPRLRSLFLFGFYNRRKTECLNLKWSDVSGSTYTVRGSISKVSADMTFVLPNDLKEALQQHMDLRNTYVFENPRTGKPITEIREHVKKIRDATGIEEFTFHFMRNLSVSALSATGASSTDLSSMLGHLDTGTLKKYLSLQRTTASKATNMLSEQLLSAQL